MKTPRCITLAIAGLAALAAALPSIAPAQEARLADLATTAQVGSGGNVLTVGFVITGTAKKTVLIRGVGPGLAAFGVGGTVADPNLTLFNSSNVAIATNDNWGTPVGGTLPITAATFSSVGAFALPANSKDAAMQIALDPGNYTAQMSAGTGAAGLGIVEVYEMDSNGGKLTNISTSGQIATGGNMIAGLVIAPGTSIRKLLIRAAGPGLGALGVPGTIADPQFKITSADGKTTFATNDNWGTPVGATALDATNLATIAQFAGAFAFPSGSKDAMAYIELGAGSYTVQVTGTGAGGLGIVEVYDLTPTTPPVINVTATKANADESGTNNGEFTFTRAGDVRAPLTVTYATGGSAVNGVDYATLPGSVTFPAGATSVIVPLVVIPDIQAEGLDPVVLTLTNSSSYTIGSASSAKVTIADSVATLYIATLRPAKGASGSTSSGTASILVASSGTIAGINVSFSNLSSAEVTAHLVLGANQDFVFNLPQGQVNGALWNFAPTGLYASSDLLNALKSGNLSVRIDTANYPSGETSGTFVQGAGSLSFSPPAAPPAVTLGNVTAADAARLLTQATFGPKQSEIDALTGGNIDTWIASQMAMPFTSHRTAIQQDQSTYGGSGSFTNWNAITLSNRQAAWFKVSLTAPDQLRQRVAFALSQLFVVSDVSLGDDNQTEPLAAYYDMLGNGAFGNFRTLLENVTLSPMMANYLSLLRNAKADPVTGQTPDENYAREVMQLFTIGLNMLQPDGTLQLGTDGLPIATYTQPTVTEMAKVFTGWAYPSTNASAFRTASTNYFSPLQLYPAFHDDTAKNLNLASLITIPASQGGTTDLKLALDALANHPNTAPFVSKQLIQRLVLSNPSPAYVYRVAQVFANDGTGVRGNLGAVVRAILEDYEARSPVVAAGVAYGKLKEPVLRLTNLMRSFNAAAPNGRYVGFQVTVNGTVITGTTPKPTDATTIGSISASTRLDFTQTQLDQAALRSPTVFNFYHPGYVLAGPLASAGLVAPEFEITDATFTINVPNDLRTFVFATATGTSSSVPVTIAPDFTLEQTLVATPTKLLDHLAAVLCQGNMPQATRDRITTALTALPATTSALEKVQTAVLLTLTSPAAATQK